MSVMVFIAVRMGRMKLIVRPFVTLETVIKHHSKTVFTTAMHLTAHATICTSNVSQVAAYQVQKSVMDFMTVLIDQMSQIYCVLSTYHTCYPPMKQGLIRYIVR